jgi:hypothetical protein
MVLISSFVLIWSSVKTCFGGFVVFNAQGCSLVLISGFVLFWYFVKTCFLGFLVSCSKLGCRFLAVLWLWPKPSYIDGHRQCWLVSKMHSDR